MREHGTLPKNVRILQAAEQIFEKHGFEGTTVDDIIQLADVGKGTLYRYFGNKEQLFYKLVSERNEGFVNDLYASLDSIEDIEERMCVFFMKLIAFYRGNGRLLQIIFFEMLGPSKACYIRRVGDEYMVVPRFAREITEEEKEEIIRYYKLIETQFAFLADILRLGQEAGILKEGDVEARTTCTFFGVVMSIFHPLEVLQSLSDDEFARVIVDRFMYGERI